eukprot:TRINITY_DN27425_c0_g2_i2.p1 TRINITY_DN27425_c0_g2~~TRINITY_DN27425_c0_g2_i2.p1  ORF type:complete len:622 (-),score=15.58 TRINITY_DN27425_c0_g2_i2:165-2030(-)
MNSAYPQQLRSDWDVKPIYPLKLRGDWDIAARLFHCRQTQESGCTKATESKGFNDDFELREVADITAKADLKIERAENCDVGEEPQNNISEKPHQPIKRGTSASELWRSVVRGLTRRSLASTVEVTCSTSIDNDLLRAVELQEVLADFGKHWASNEGCDEDYNLSHVVKQISAFVSHDWGTSRVVKLAALLCYSNMAPAVLLSLLATLVVPVSLRAGGVGFSAKVDAIYPSVCGDIPMPRMVALWSAAIGFSVFLCVFAFWQRLRAKFWSPTTVFLDKLCIHQTDTDRKTAGILGLAAFLGASQRLVVLWSERYFTRLWCTYELAAWCKLGRGFADTVTFVPAEAALRVFVLICGCSATLLAYELMIITFGLDGWWVQAMWLLFGVLYCGFAMHTYRVLYASLSCISMQLEAYKIGEADCYCCSHRHTDPITGAVLKCDRELVMRTLRNWRFQETGQSDDAAEHYNEFVTKELRLCRDLLLDSVSSFKHGFLLSLAPLWGNFARAWAQLLWLALGDDSDRFTSCGTLRSQVCLLIDALQLALCWKLLFYIARRSSQSAPDVKCRPRLRTSFLLGFVVCVVALTGKVLIWRFFLFLPVSIIAVCGSIVVLLELWVYWPCRRR